MYGLLLSFFGLAALELLPPQNHLIPMANSSETKPACKSLVLDAGPLLSLSPLRGLAETFYTVPQVLDELKDKRAREHFEKLGLTAGVNIQVQSPDPVSLAHGMSIVSGYEDNSRMIEIDNYL